jgi:hypothetical protein
LLAANIEINGTLIVVLPWEKRRELRTPSRLLRIALLALKISSRNAISASGSGEQLAVDVVDLEAARLGPPLRPVRHVPDHPFARTSPNHAPLGGRRRGGPDASGRADQCRGSAQQTLSERASMHSRTCLGRIARVPRAEPSD